MAAAHFIALIFTLCSFALLLIANLGTTFQSTFLPNIHLIQINEAVSGRYIRYGVYNSCLYYPGSTIANSCTKAIPGYTFDSYQFAEACGADLTNSTTTQVFLNVVSDANLVTFKGIILIMPAVVLSFVAFTCTLFLRKSRSSNVIQFIGTFASIFCFFTGAAGLALVIITFWKGLAILEGRVQGLSHQWGPAIYLVGIGSGCMLIGFVCFVITLFTSSDSRKRETFHLYDYDLNTDTSTNTPITVAASYDTTAHLNSPPTAKHDSYKDYNNTNHAVTTPTTQQQNYPSYYQYQQQQQPSYEQYDNTANYQQQPQYHNNNYQQQHQQQQQTNNYGNGNYY